MSRKPKVLLVSQALAPAVGGSTILLNNLFKYFEGEVLAISGYPGSRTDANFKPTFNTVYFNPPNIPFIGKYLKRYHDNLLRYFHPLIINRIVSQIRKFKPDVVFSNCPDIDYFICAYVAAKKTNTLFYAHMHDLWEENHGPETYVGQMAIKWEKEILLSASQVLCMTDIQAMHYQKKYGITTKLLPHTILDSDLEEGKLSFKRDFTKTALFTGTVSKVMNQDALNVFSKATQLLPEEIKVIMCTSTTHELFSRIGIDSSKWDIKWMSRMEVQDLQTRVGVLFAPLSHENGGMDEIRTVFSTKLLEYLVSGRPIIIFAPKNSFHSISATEGNWALVINENNSEDLAKGINKLIGDIELQENLVNNAFLEANARKASIHANKLLNLIKSEL
jgi:glycosyltransferase involved in cell wall biosynthesis